jgi:hypothetical protein
VTRPCYHDDADSAGRRERYHSLGLVPHPYGHLELPQPRGRRADAARYPPRRGLFLCHPDIQHHAAVPHSQQAYVPARLSAAGQGKWTGHVHWPHRGLGWTCPTGTMVGHAATT